MSWGVQARAGHKVDGSTHQGLELPGKQEKESVLRGRESRRLFDHNLTCQGSESPVLKAVLLGEKGVASAACSGSCGALP